MKEFFALGALLLMTCSLGACNFEPPWPDGQTEVVKNGAYHASGRNREYVVIYEDYISLISSGGDAVINSHVYRFSLEGDTYIGKSIYNKYELLFKRFGDVLTINTVKPIFHNQKFLKLKLKLDPSAVVSKEEPIQLPMPENVYISYSNDHRFPYFSFYPKDISYIPVAIAVSEIKYEGTEDFELVCYTNRTGGSSRYYQIVFRRDESYPQGVHIVRIKIRGGPYVHFASNNPSNIDEIKICLDSEPVYFKFTVDSEGKANAEEISDYK